MCDRHGLFKLVVVATVCSALTQDGSVCSCAEQVGVAVVPRVANHASSRVGKG